MCTEAGDWLKIQAEGSEFLKSPLDATCETLDFHKRRIETKRRQYLDSKSASLSLDSFCSVKYRAYCFGVDRNGRDEMGKKSTA
jgi:hypothetical protein